jgi:hypothetical protein
VEANATRRRRKYDMKPLFEGKMKPILILPPDSMSTDDIELLNANGICTVVAKDPAAVKFLDPIPSAAERTKTESAAIELGRKIMSKDFWTSAGTRDMICGAYVDLLVKGTSLDPRPSQKEREQEIFDIAKADELRRLAREEAKAQRAEAKLKSDAAKKAKESGKA